MSSSSIFGASSNAPVTIAGVTSGLNTTAIIQQLTSAENTAVNNYQSQQASMQTNISAWQGINADLLSLQTQASSLGTLSTFSSATATSSNTAVAAVTAQPGAQVGNHTLSVQLLAQAQKVMSQSFGDPNTPLGFTGSFVLNGKTISVASSDTLASLVTKINGANAGANASLVNIGPGNVRMTITASNSGTQNALSAADTGGSQILESLGLLPSSGQTTSIRQAITGQNGNAGAGSIAFNSATQGVAAMIGATSGTAPSGTVQINGVNVSIDLNTMSLTDVANAINQAGITGVTAQVVAIPDANGSISASSQQQLQITGASGAITNSSFTDSNGVLSTLGITQTGFADQISGAKDAQFTLDGISYTRSSNVVNDAINGVSINLLQADPTGNTATTNIDITQNTDNVISAINGFVSAYNQIVKDINSQFQFAPPAGGATGTSGGQTTNTPPLFGDFTLTEIQNQLANVLNTTAGGTSLGNVGITVNQDGTLGVDSGKLTTALSTNPQQVYSLFGLTGTSTNSNVTFVSGTVKTQASSGVGYPVNITQPATQAIVTAAAQTSPLAQAETLTFTGSLFGTGSVSITLPPNSTEQNIIDLINQDSNLNQVIYASQDANGQLQIASKGYGSADAFNVVSNIAAGANTSGIGSAALIGTGQDVAGTINGEPATGVGQTLTGKPGNANTAGLQLLVTATSAGSYGSIDIVHGLADQLNSLATQITDPNTGSIIDAEDSINTQISQVQQQITNTQTQLNAYTQFLQTEFANMESSLTALQSQSSALSAEVASTANLLNASSSSHTGGLTSSSQGK
ncbi:MAG TPA: flagellar filament capping protein FliD [Capsulimonadaceae bacterium]|nr:flagellar filament capping protein FliD [Capsulimonadaceae bacterium]